MCIRDRLWDAGQHRQALRLLIPIMLECSPGADGDKIWMRAQFDDDGALHTWRLSSCKLTALPEEFCTVRTTAVSYTHLRAHETVLDLVCRLLLEKKNHETGLDIG
eukprot:TRINITY_DN8537_c0_g1_i4.p1 TRINITY_DN8537_c0_g1~~TRINITY_DN8537_c0_g1_i4.p1  ORF type:complete len:117 (+),score=18.59 TRINITY_DN8537_c0_g1_i4:34-351(+)